MKKLKEFSKIVVGLLILSVVLSGCYVNGNWNCIRGNGKVITETRDITGFHSVSYRSSGLMVLRQGDKDEVKIEAEENIIPLISTRNINGVLVIDRHDCSNRSRQVQVYVTMKEFQGIEIEGSADVIGETTMVGKDVELETNGSGDIDLSLEAEKLEISIYGSGDMKLSGSAGATDIAIRGSGDIEAKKLATKKVSISIMGSGDATIHAVESIDVSIMGSGDVYYRGQPAVKDLSILGSGNFRNIN